MTDAESLLLLIGAIYVTECLVWVPRQATVLYTRWGRRWRWAQADQLWGNQRGGLLLLNPLPGIGIGLLCQDPPAPAQPPPPEAVHGRLALFRRQSRWLRLLNLLLAVHLFGGGAGLIWLSDGDWAVALYLLVAIVLVLLTLGVFWRTHRRLYPEARGQRWQRSLTMLVCPPAAVRATDDLGLRLFAGWPTLSVLEALCEPAVYGDYARRLFHDAGTLQQHPELNQPPATDDPTARSYCPRCHALYQLPAGTCRDCQQVGLQPLPQKP